MEYIGIISGIAFALQRFVEIIIDPIVDKFWPEYKKLLLPLIAFILGEIISFTANLSILPKEPDLGILKFIITGFVISGGTELVNSFIKLMGYKKEEQKERMEKIKN